MAKRTDKERDKQLIARLQAEAPGVLKARVDFDSVIAQIAKHALGPDEVRANRSKS
jgi:hypothetical protein